MQYGKNRMLFDITEKHKFIAMWKYKSTVGLIVILKIITDHDLRQNFTLNLLQ